MLAIILLVAGTVGCALVVLGEIGGFEFELFGHHFAVTVTTDWRTLLLVGPLLIAGIALWFFAMRARPGERAGPEI